MENFQFLIDLLAFLLSCAATPRVFAPVDLFFTVLHLSLLTTPILPHYECSLLTLYDFWSCIPCLVPSDGETVDCLGLQTLQTQDDDWDTDPDYVNDLSEKDQRYGAHSITFSLHILGTEGRAEQIAFLPIFLPSFKPECKQSLTI